MTKGEQAHEVTPLQSGWTALANGRWESARAAFTRAVETRRTAEALEGLSWAAWWLDDAETVFEARRRAFQLYRRGGEPASAARMAIWLAVDELDFRGAFAVGNGWLKRAQRLLEPLEALPEHGWLAFNEGYFAYARGQTRLASELAERATLLGRRFAVPDLEMLGLALRGSVMVNGLEVEQGMACLDEATALALSREATVPISTAWACCFLVTACEAVRDYPRAFEWCDRIAEFAQRYGSRYMLGFCRAHYGAVHLWRGRWDAAESELEAAAEAYARSRPALVGEALARLAELRRRQGRWEEAERLLEEGGADATLCRAALALDRGHPAQAAALAERVLRRTPEQRSLTRAPALELLLRARLEQADLAAATDTLQELRELTRLVGTVPLQAAADLGAGLLATARGKHEEARCRFEDAVDAYQQSGAAYDAAQARIGLAECLLALGEVETAAREARLALARLTELGAAVDARRARSVLDAAEAAEHRAPALRRLTRREREVLGCVADGLTNRQIGERLVVSEHTIHRHISNILRKLDLPSRTAAVAYAARSGLLPTSSE
jgi:LuxR family transcriptional regulator, maltose regulon positive regulatory protein